MNENSKIESAEMANRSGQVSSNEKLVGFLYLLLRDHLPAGTVEEIIKTHLVHDIMYFSNGWLASYAQDIAERLKK